MNQIELFDHWAAIEAAPVRISGTEVSDSVARIKMVMENRNLRATVRQLELANRQLKAMIDSGDKPGFLYWVTHSELLTDAEKQTIQRRMDQDSDVSIFDLCDEALEQNARAYDRMFGRMD